jgi:hypothetical protein
MDLTKPIDITAVNTAVKKHGNEIQTIDNLDANAVLQHFSPMPGITDSYTFTNAWFKSVSSKYTGKFKDVQQIGTIDKRTLIVNPCVIEVLDEPERYRRSYITEVRGAIEIAQHPFEMWLIENVLKQASTDLLNVLFTAKYDAAADKTELKDSFDGPGTIVETEKTAGNISVAKGNQFATGAFTRADVGKQLLSLWRHMPQMFKNMNSKLFISGEIGDLYDDWFSDEHPNIHTPGQNPDESNQTILYGSKGKCELVRVPDLPDKSQFAMLTIQPNIVYGFDKFSDLRTIKAVPDDYLFKALGKYVFGTQFVTLDSRIFCVNDQPLTPANP